MTLVMGARFFFSTAIKYWGVTGYGPLMSLQRGVNLSSRSDDFANACVFLLKNYSAAQFINIGTGEDISIAEFARAVADVVGFRGKIVYDTSKPDGTPRKLPDVSRLSAMGCKAKVPLRAGLTNAYADFLTSKLRER